MPVTRKGRGDAPPAQRVRPAIPDARGARNEDAYTLVDEVEDIPGGETATLNVTLDPGHYVIICNIKGHYRMGMESELTVS